MHGLDLTYETLGKSRNEAAIDVLIAALEDANPVNRRRAIEALMSRREARAPEMLLANWPKLTEQDIAIVRLRKQWMHDAVEAAFESDCELPAVAIAAAESLQLTSVMPTLIRISESAGSRNLRSIAGKAVTSIAEQLGIEARAARDQTSVRSPVLGQLRESLLRFSMHRNEQLAEAFLICSSWSDIEIRQLLGEKGPTRDLLCRLFLESNHPSLVELLAGHLRRRNLWEPIASILAIRTDDRFRDQLLMTVGKEPTPSVLKNLKQLGFPNCCRGGENLMRQLPIECQAAFTHVQVACGSDHIAALHVIATAAETGTQDCVGTAITALSRCQIPNAETWMRAALHIAEDDDPATGDDETTRLLRRMIALLEHPDAALNKSIRRVLAALHSVQMLPHFQMLRLRSRRRLGQVVMLIDEEATERVRDALRHPVLTKRLEAIAMADALEVVDELYDSFARIAREDHQEARIRAAEAMSDARTEATLGLLQEMIGLPDCPVRDAAIEAIRLRQDAARQFNSRDARVDR